MTLDDIALTMTPGVGIKVAVHLLDIFGDAERIFAATEQELIIRAQIKADVAAHIVARTAFKSAERELEYCRRHNIYALASTDVAYPDLLREIPDYPHVIYVQGDPTTLGGQCLSMVGTRESTPYGQQMCIELVRGLSERVQGLCIVSGLAFGIDVASHRAALASGVNTVAVLPCSLPEVVPTQHAALARDILASGGALVSEINSQVKQKGTFYLARNRIIAALSAGTVVVESPCSGGSLMTAHCADGYHRAVMAVPGRASDRASRGSNILIRNKKAQLVLSAEDIISELMWDTTASGLYGESRVAMPQLTANEARVLGCFRTDDPVSVDVISTEVGLGSGDLSVLLLGLEMSGVVRQLPGNMYMKLIWS